MAGPWASGSSAGRVDARPPSSSPLAYAASTCSLQGVDCSSSVSVCMGSATAGDEVGRGEVGTATTVARAGSACDDRVTCGNHGRGTDEVDGARRCVAGSGVTAVSALKGFPDDGAVLRWPGRQKPGHNLASAAPLPVPWPVKGSNWKGLRSTTRRTSTSCGWRGGGSLKPLDSVVKGVGQALGKGRGRLGA